MGDRRAHHRVRLQPNRVAALGANVILLVNLAWSAVLYIRFLRGRGSVTVERWQTDYLPVYAVWAAIVVIVFPPVFGTSDRPCGKVSVRAGARGFVLEQRDVAQSATSSRGS